MVPILLTVPKLSYKTFKILPAVINGCVKNQDMILHIPSPLAFEPQFVLVASVLEIITGEFSEDEYSAAVEQ